MSSSILFRGKVKISDGWGLETVMLGLRRVPENRDAKVAVFVHPWSWLGGRLNDPVLDALTTPFLEDGYYVVLFNSRGVGESEGSASWTGLREGEDLKEIVRWCVDKVNAKKVALVGYSYGALICSLHPVLPPPVETLHVLLSYPLSTRSLITFFRGSTYAEALNNLTTDPRSNILLLYSDQDQFTAADKYDTWSQELGSKTQGRWKVHLIRGGDHFWRGQAKNQMLSHLEAWLRG